MKALSYFVTKCLLQNKLTNWCNSPFRHFSLSEAEQETITFGSKICELLTTAGYHSDFEQVNV